MEPARSLIEEAPVVRKKRAWEDSGGLEDRLTGPGPWAGGVWKRGEDWRQELQGVFQAEVVAGAREVGELRGPLPIVGRRKGQRNQKALGILGAEGRPSSVQTRVGPLGRADIPPRLGQTPHNALEQMSHSAFGAS